MWSKSLEDACTRQKLLAEIGETELADMVREVSETSDRFGARLIAALRHLREVGDFAGYRFFKPRQECLSFLDEIGNSTKITH